MKHQPTTSLAVAIAHSRDAKQRISNRYVSRKKKQTAMLARSIQTELPIARIETTRSFALELLNPFPAMGRASLAPKAAARSRLRIRIPNDAISDIAKGKDAQSAIPKWGQKRPNATSAIPAWTAVVCADSPIRGLRKRGIAAPIARPSVKTMKPALPRRSSTAPILRPLANLAIPKTSVGIY